MRHRYSVVNDGVTLSAVAVHCWEFNLNPDLEELKRYNKEAKQRECRHPRAATLQGDDWTRWHCPDCS